MKKTAVSLAVAAGLSGVLLTGCGTDGNNQNNGMTTQGTNRMQQQGANRMQGGNGYTRTRDSLQANRAGNQTNAQQGQTRSGINSDQVNRDVNGTGLGAGGFGTMGMNERGGRITNPGANNNGSAGYGVQAQHAGHAAGNQGTMQHDMTHVDRNRSGIYGYGVNGTTDLYQTANTMRSDKTKQGGHS
ncbi:hypothetical protein DNH61_08960 [Paenibacillus sambharensis]|uniref:Lipoprotein n=1 Tax=Paenibacillus sambharensis TaxID=1803190 RepID=A0A2W1LP68_9BACL|nr:hypothetical protein [Paenibacillus sambharensis]PZD96314.1 hypothetical protein DNH61_08960 [Paenibacillus sambharensis]